MRTLPLLLSLGLTSSALAANPLLDGPDAVDIAGTVDVDLLRVAETHHLPTVLVTAPSTGDEPEDHQFLSLLDISYEWSTIPASDAKKLGLKVKEKKGIKRTVVPEVRVGDLVLRDLPVEVGSDHWVLGVGTFSQVATALLPSEGKVRFVPSSEGAALLSSIGTSLPAAASPEKEWDYHGVKKGGYSNGLGLQVQGVVNGVEGQVMLATYKWGNHLPEKIPLENPVRMSGILHGTANVALGGIGLVPAWSEQDQTYANLTGDYAGQIGYSSLYNLDIAVDPAGLAFAIRPVSEVKASDSTIPFDLAKTAFEDDTPKDDDEKDKDEDESSDSSGPDKGDAKAVKRHTAWAAALWNNGKRSEALEQFTLAAEAGGDQCAPFHRLGQSHLSMGQAAEAAENFRKAGELWDQWYQQDRTTRYRVKNDKSVPEGTYTLAQSSSCHTAWGDLANAHLALKQYDEVGKVMSEHLDLDPVLPLAYAIAMIKQDNYQEATGALHRSLNMGLTESDSARVALGSVYANVGSTQQVLAQVERLATEEEGVELHIILPMMEVARQAGGDALAKETAERFHTYHPLAIAPALALAMEAKRTGSDASAHLSAADERIEQFALARPNDISLPIYRAISTGLHGDAAAGLKQLNDAISRKTIPAESYAARAVLSELAAKHDEAIAAANGLSLIHPDHPASLATFSPPSPMILPPAPPTPELPEEESPN